MQRGATGRDRDDHRLAMGVAMLSSRTWRRIWAAASAATSVDGAVQNDEERVGADARRDVAGAESLADQGRHGAQDRVADLRVRAGRSNSRKLSMSNMIIDSGGRSWGCERRRKARSWSSAASRYARL